MFELNFAVYKECFIREYGERKFNKIVNRIIESKKIRKMIFASSQKHLAPTKNDILYCLKEIPFFMFSMPDTLAMGGILVLDLWYGSVNSILKLIDDNEVLYILEGIVSDCNSLKFKLKK